MLENPQTVVSSLLEGPDSTPLFETLLFKRQEILENDVRAAYNAPRQIDHMGGLSTTSSHAPLPRVLKLQLDNCSGDNKNRFVFAYLSLLTAREVFEEVHLGFLMVGHTHEDVDAMFGHFSESLMHHPAYSLPELMSLLMRARRPNAVPHFVQEVPDFKTYLEPFLLPRSEALVGHLKPRLFRFYVRVDKMPCFQYKLKSNDVTWLPDNGIELWTRTDANLPYLPTGIPKRLPMIEMKCLDMIKVGLEKTVHFFNYTEQLSRKSGFAGNWAWLVDYWTRVLDLLKSQDVRYHEQDGKELQFGFWPISNWKHHVPENYRNVACEIDTQIHYVGPRKDKPREPFNPRVDIHKDHFILVRPATEDEQTYPVYLGKVVGEVVEGNMNDEGKLEHVCNVQWYRPYMEKKRGRPECSPRERWLKCWVKKWEQDPGYPVETQSVNAVLWCFKPRASAKSHFVKISPSAAKSALDCLSRSCVESEDVAFESDCES